MRSGTRVVVIGCRQGRRLLLGEAGASRRSTADDDPRHALPEAMGRSSVYTRECLHSLMQQHRPPQGRGRTADLAQRPRPIGDFMTTELVARHCAPSDRDVREHERAKQTPQFDLRIPGARRGRRTSRRWLNV